MKISNKVTLAAFAVSALFAAGAVSPTYAAVILCEGANCVNTDANVLVNSGTGPGLTGTYNNADVEVNFSSTMDTLIAGSNGQASVGAMDNLLNDLTFTIENGFGFTTALFNLAPIPGNVANEAVSVFIKYTLADGTPGSITQSIGTNGQNFVGIFGTNGETFTSAGFAANPNSTGIGDFRQLRLGGVAPIGAVPEPAAWMMMLIGMFGVGYSMRRPDNASSRVRFA